MRLRHGLLALALFGLVAASGCGDDDDGNEHDSGTVADGGTSGDSSTASGAFGAVCTGTGQGTCATGLTCFPFNTDGPRCTKSCMSATAATDCAPSTFGCSGMNVCKIKP